MKRWLACLVVCLMILVAGAAMAQRPSPFHILHKSGALYNAEAGWTLTTPPYYPGTDWAVDFVYTSMGPAILHQDGCIWTPNGWLMDGYYAGSDYARAMKALPDLSGCWCAYSGEWGVWKGSATADGYDLEGNYFYSGYPNEYAEITQTGRYLTVHNCEWDGEGWECDDVYGTVVGDHIALHAGGTPVADDCSWGVELVGSYFWNQSRGSLGIELATVESDLYCQGSAIGEEEGWFGILYLWQTYSTDGGATWLPCVCPPE